ncbi:S-layer homology domain-containing protein [Helicovermis profundi]|uniref:SLH domain-containing protein n=1 Tax=Helicovermis profundi TaxID=3065157 RepID=A0AAU9E6I7_9FIRM|nr:hypothetical protein HLPR_27020 [Clostridia bacterium S502]
MKRKLSLVLIFLMIFSTTSVYADVTPTSQAVGIMQSVYSNFTDTERGYLHQARAEVDSITDAQWQGLITGDGLFTYYNFDSANHPYEGEYQAGTKIVNETDVKDLISGLLTIYFNSDSSQIESEIASFKTANKSLFTTLLPNSSADQLINLVIDSKENVADSITTSEKSALVMASTKSTLTTAIENALQTAVGVELDKSKYTTLKTDMQQIGWNSTKLVGTINSIINSLTIGEDAEAALANAIIRESSTINANTSFYEGNSQTVSLNVLESSTNLIKLNSADSTIVSVSGLTLKGVKKGTTTIYVYRVGAPESDMNNNVGYIYSFSVTVKEKSTTSGTTPTGTTDTTTPTTTEPTNVDDTTSSADSDVVDSENVKDEAAASAISDSVASTASSLAKLVVAGIDEKEISTLATNMSSVLKASANIVKTIETPEAAKSAIENQISVVKNVATVSSVLNNNEDTSKVLDQTKDLLNSSDSLFAKLEDKEVVLDLTKSLIESSVSLITNVDENKEVNGKEVVKSTKALKNAVVKVAQSYVENVSTTTLDTTKTKVEEGKALVSATLDDMIKDAKSSLDAVKTINKTLKDSKVISNKKVQAVVTIKVPLVEGAKTTEVTLPKLKDVFDVVDTVKVQSPQASFEINKNTFNNLKGGDVALSAETVKLTDMLQSKRKNIPSGATVIELNAKVAGEKVNKFNKPMNITIPYTLAEGENTNEVTVFLLQDDGSVKAVGGKYVDGKVTFKTNHFSKYFAKTARAKFNDLDKAEWAKDYVELLGGKGIVKGVNGNDFEPNSKITRAEFVALLTRAMAYKGDSKNNKFTDVDSNSWYADSVYAAYDNKIVGGKSQTMFAPNDKITREEMATMIANAMLEEGYKYSDFVTVPYEDAMNISNWAVRSIILTSNEDIVNGFESGAFMPKENATRAQAATMIYRLFEK